MKNNKYNFTVRGHNNVLALHKNTVEFTKDKELTLNGDCILGVDANFSLQKIKEILKQYNKLKLRVSVGDFSQSILFSGNIDFDDGRELVLRKSNFNSKRTLGCYSDLAAFDIDRKIVKQMKNEKTKMSVELSPQKKLFIFDFDETLADFAGQAGHLAVAKELYKEFGVFEPTTLELIDQIDSIYSHMGVAKECWYCDRYFWFETLFLELGIEFNEKTLKKYVKLYWEPIQQKSKALKDAKKLLKFLKKYFIIVILSDSDGTKKLKIDRAKRTKILEHVDYLVTSDDVGINKPNKLLYDLIFKKFDVRTDECVMLGDKPEVDLKLAKELGMTTIWTKQGLWAKKEGDKKFGYVDYEVTCLKEVIDIVQNELL